MEYFLSEGLAMKNDITWEHTDNSKRNKQQAARSPGNLVGLRSKSTARCSLLICF
jgi:hypothetical protein